MTELNIHETGPLGKVIVDSGVETYVSNMAAKWDAQKTASPWWQVWKKVSFVSVTNFLLKALDDLINYVDGLIAENIDKKATVIDAATKLYDKIIYEAMPVWLKPFSPMIRKIIIGQVLPAVVDYIVAGYHSGSWNKKDPEVIAQMFGAPGDDRLPR